MDMIDKLELTVIIGALTSVVTIDGAIIFITGAICGIVVHKAYLSLWKKSHL